MSAPLRLEKENEPVAIVGMGETARFPQQSRKQSRT